MIKANEPKEDVDKEPSDWLSEAAASGLVADMRRNGELDSRQEGHGQALDG